MAANVINEYFGGAVKIIKPLPAFADARGWFSIPYREDEYEALGLPKFVQDNHSSSYENVVRGLHFQINPPMGKLMRVTRGRAFIVAVDIRVESPTFKNWVGVFANPLGSQMWATGDFARGFASLDDNTEVQYKCDSLYTPLGDVSVRWDDPTIGIIWPVGYPILSEKDKNAPTIDEWYAKNNSRLLIPEQCCKNVSKSDNR